jgi:hypothetical protein
LEAEGFSGTEKDQRERDYRNVCSSKRENMMHKEREHGTAMDFCEMVVVLNCRV